MARGQPINAKNSEVRVGTKPAAPKRERKRVDPARILEAAIFCIEKYGIDKTFTDDIARAAGVSRPTVYRAFPDRMILLEAIAATRLERLAVQAKRIVASYSQFEDALIFGSIRSVTLARADTVYRLTVEALNQVVMEKYLIGPDAPMIAFMDHVWRETLVAARLAGSLRTDLKDSEILDWLRSVHLILFLREDLKPDQVADLMRKFVLPALGPAPAARRLERQAETRRPRSRGGNGAS